MIEIRPVALSVVEGRNFILGTFDTSGFQTWWKSLPFPGDVESIGDPTHVYGQYHVCIVKMRDGSYSIYRTHDSGKTWTNVYNTPDTIYSITSIDYGWVIASTSTGWLESKLDSGLTWTKISNFAPGCRTVINVGDDILFGHDGNRIWRSFDYAKTWSIVLDQTSWKSKPLHYSWAEYTFSRTGYSYPALAGINKTIFVGFGPYLIISDDLGETWTTHPSGWNNSVFNQPRWGNASFSPNAKNQIMQIILTEGLGKSSSDSKIMVKNLVNNTVNYMYSGPFFDGTTHYSAGWYWQTVFSNTLNSSTSEISTYNVLRVGTSSYDTLTVITTVDSNNNPVVMKSINGGLNWININLSNANVYEGDPSQEIISGLGQHVFDEEYWTTYTWVGAPCHNEGTWLSEYNKTVRGLSWDTDIIAIFKKLKPYGMLYTTLITKEKNCQLDILNKDIFNKNSYFDILMKDTLTKNMIIGGFFNTTFENSYDIIIANAFRLISLINCDLLSLKSIDKFVNVRMNLLDNATKSYGFDIILKDDYVDKIMNQIEEYTLQAPDIRYPNIPYSPFDSRERSVT